MDPIVHEFSVVDRIVPCPELMLVREWGKQLVSCVYVSSDDGQHEGLDSLSGRRLQAIATKEKKNVIFLLFPPIYSLMIIWMLIL
jgi:hypothetical protein